MHARPVKLHRYSNSAEILSSIGYLHSSKDIYADIHAAFGVNGSLIGYNFSRISVDHQIAFSLSSTMLSAAEHLN